MTKFNNWGVSYTSIVWFESYLSSHPNVKLFDRRDDIIFDIHRRSQQDTVSVMLSTDYVFGVAHFYKAMGDFQNINAIVLAGNWNKFTADASDAALMADVPLFTPKGLYAALFKDRVK